MSNGSYDPYSPNGKIGKFLFYIYTNHLFIPIIVYNFTHRVKYLSICVYNITAISLFVVYKNLIKFFSFKFKANIL